MAKTQKPSNNDPRKKKIAQLLLAELKEGKREVWYVSIAHEVGGFIGGVFVDAFGPTDAWTMVHNLNLFPYGMGADTQTSGPMDDELCRVSRIPKYVLLDKPQMMALNARGSELLEMRKEKSSG